MKDLASQPPRPVPEEASRARRKQVRGSTLLMVGRGLSLALNLAAQVLTVRYLAKLEYGAFAFGLSITSMLSSFAVFGMNKAALRLIPLYHEKRDAGRMLGATVLMCASVLALGLGCTVLVLGFQGLIDRSLASSPLSLTILLSLILLAPIDALDSLAQSMFSIFSRPRLIFFRRHVLGPGLKVLAVLAVMAVGGDVRLLAVAYVAAGLLGLAIAGALAWRVFREQELLRGSPVRMILPTREVFGLSLPFLQSEMVMVLRSSLVIPFIEYFHGSASVADFRSVLPVARLNQVVLESFTLLFMPAVARLLARRQHDDVHELHWLTATWVMVLTFPVFAMTFAFAGPLSILLFGERYASSHSVLAVLSLGFFVHAGLGVSGQTLKASGLVRRLVLIDGLAVVVALGLNLALIPRYGAEGGAFAVCGAMIFHVVAYQGGLSFGGTMAGVPRRFLASCAVVAACVAVLALIQGYWSPPLYVGVGLTSVAWLLVIATSAHALQVRETFPELLRVRLVRRLLEA